MCSAYAVSRRRIEVQDNARDRGILTEEGDANIDQVSAIDGYVVQGRAGHSIGEVDNQSVGIGQSLNDGGDGPAGSDRDVEIVGARNGDVPNGRCWLQ